MVIAEVPPSRVMLDKNSPQTLSSLPVLFDLMLSLQSKETHNIILKNFTLFSPTNTSGCRDQQFAILDKFHYDSAATIDSVNFTQQTNVKTLVINIMPNGTFAAFCMSAE